jgi:hypothetical protein
MLGRFANPLSTTIGHFAKVSLVLVPSENDAQM